MADKNTKKESNGIFHNGTDYAFYHMKLKETLIGAAIGGILGGIVVQIFFMTSFITVLATPVCIVLGAFLYRQFLLDRRQKRLIMQFRDMLESLSSSLGSGRNVTDAFMGALSDMSSQYGERSEIVGELGIIKQGIDNNINIEILLQDFALRSHDENIQSFADVFEVANRRGGNMREIVFETKNKINEKIMVEQEIQTIISGKKNELNIMMVLPLIVINQTRTLFSDVESSPRDILIKFVAFGMFLTAYFVGRRMMRIEV